MTGEKETGNTFSFNQEFSGTDVQVNQGQHVSNISKTTNYGEGVDPWQEVLDEVAKLDEANRSDAEAKVGILKDMSKMESADAEAIGHMDQVLGGLKRYGPGIAMLAANALMGSPLGAIKEAKSLIEKYIDTR